jgi:uncharacterized protein YjiS (DUF1127 family)
MVLRSWLLIMFSMVRVSCSAAVFTAFSHELHSTHPLLHCGEPRHYRPRPTAVSTDRLHHNCLKGKTMLISLIALIRRYARYRSDLASIRHLDERTLRDIGISHGELATYARRYDAHRPYP